MIDQRLYLEGLGDESDIETAIAPAVSAYQAKCLGPDAGTNYCLGYLRGWTRIFTKHFSVFTSVAAPGFSPDPSSLPSQAEWADFDKTAAELGVDQVTMSARLSAEAAGQNSNFLQKASSNLKALDVGVTQPIAHALERGDVIAAGAAAQNAILKASNQLDKVVPGSGGVVADLFVSAISPILPFAPALTSSLATASGNVPFLGSTLGPAVSTSGGAGQQLVEGIRAQAQTEGPETAFDVATQQEIGNGLASAIQSYATDGAAAISPLKETLAKIQQAYQQANGSLLEKLEAAGVEALNELSFAVSVACTLASAGTATVFCQLMQRGLDVLKAGITLANALAAADALKKAAAQAHAQAQSQSDALDQEIAQLEAELGVLTGSPVGAGVGAGAGSVLGAAALAFLAWELFR